MRQFMIRGTMGGLLLTALVGCSHDVSIPARPDPADPGGLFTLQTRLGPVDVLRFEETEDGTREIEIQGVGPDGDRFRRTIRVKGTESTEVPGLFTYSFAISEGDAEGFRFQRRIREGSPLFLELTLEGDGEILHYRSKPVPGGVAVAVSRARAGGTDRVRLRLDSAQLEDPESLVRAQRVLGELAADGGATRSRERDLLFALVESSDWDEVLVPVDRGFLHPSDPETERRIRRVCTGAAVAKFSCALAGVFAPAWVVCVPAAGINLACLGYHIIQEFMPPPPDPCAYCEGGDEVGPE